MYALKIWQGYYLQFTPQSLNILRFFGIPCKKYQDLRSQIYKKTVGGSLGAKVYAYVPCGGFAPNPLKFRLSLLQYENPDRSAKARLFSDVD
jgi:hypothetical protein